MIPAGSPADGPDFPLWSVAPFAGLLLSIALLPLAAPRWWHSNRNKGLVSALFGLPVALWVAWIDPSALAHTSLEYAAFIAVTGALYALSGTIRVGGGTGTPTSNTGILALGAVAANLVGTTGAAMLLIRPYLRANRRRADKTHLVVFFIFIVANCGGLLTPLGDPPLFLGFLKGVPFTWTLGLWKQWLFTVGLLLAVFYLLDRRRFGRENPASPGDPGAADEENPFSWRPLAEVAVLFAGIFAAMIPALAILQTRGTALGIEKPWQYFWATGSLSAVLDNAPTYLAFLSAAQHLPDQVAGTTHAALAAIACGSVFFGAMTYIGNGPNFMVKAIAEHAGVRMPSFFGYLGWSLAVLIPIFLGVTALFF